MATWGEVYTSIEPYYIGGYWYNGIEWVEIFLNTEMVDGRSYFISVSQNCTLDWLDYHFDFVAGSNEMVWKPVPASGWTLGAGRLIFIERSEPTGPGGWVLGDTATVLIQPSEPAGAGGWVLGDAVILSIQPIEIPNGNGEPPEEDWQAWLEKNWPWVAVAGVGTAGLILAWPKDKRKPRRR